MTKRKLQHFAELETFQNVIQADMKNDLSMHPMKGNWNKSFFKRDRPIVLELGCGKGEYTVNLAMKYPDKNYIGIDIKGNRIWRGSKTAIENGMTNVGFSRIQIEHIEYFFAEDEVSEIWITFPDPQSKYKTEKKRLTSPDFLMRYKKIIKLGGIIHLKTDSRFLYDYTMGILKDKNIKINISSADIYKEFPDEEVLQIQTFYEKKFLAQGIPITYINFSL